MVWQWLPASPLAQQRVPVANGGQINPVLQLGIIGYHSLPVRYNAVSPDSRQRIVFIPVTVLSIMEPNTCPWMSSHPILYTKSSFLNVLPL